MKKYSLIIIGIMTLLLSCSEFLVEDPKGQLAPDSFFAAKSDLDLAITAMFDQFFNLNARVGYGGICNWGDDIIISQPKGNKLRFVEFDSFNYNSGNGELGAWYELLWRTIKATNFVIENAERTPADEEFINHRLGQAYFIRAYCYFNLVRAWGEVPIITEISINYEREKSSVAEIYEFIESDCKTAEEMLPDNHTVDPYSQNGINVAPAKAAAKALLASVYMTEAGWPLEKGASYYDLAAAKYKEIINNEETYGYILEPNPIDLTVETTGNFSHEIVFGAFYNQYQDWYASPWAELPEESGGWNDLMVELEFYNSMPDGPRKEAWILSEVNIKGEEDEFGRPKMVSYDSPETIWKHPYWRKNIDAGNWNFYVDTTGNRFYTSGGTTQRSGKTQFVFRYADILLLYAEAKAFGSAGPDGLAYDCVNRVRERAELENLSDGLSVQEFQKAVLDERRWETGGMEHSCMSRFFTMQRHKLLHLQNEYRHPDDKALVPLNSRLTLSEEFYYFPIPDRETLIVPDVFK